jgi:hypothetical protein
MSSPLLLMGMCAPGPMYMNPRSWCPANSLAIMGFSRAGAIGNEMRYIMNPELMGASLLPSTTDRDLEPTPSAAATRSAVSVLPFSKATPPMSAVSKKSTTRVLNATGMPSSLAYV